MEERPYREQEEIMAKKLGLSADAVDIDVLPDGLSIILHHRSSFNAIEDIVRVSDDLSPMLPEQATVHTVRMSRDPDADNHAIHVVMPKDAFEKAVFAMETSMAADVFARKIGSSEQAISIQRKGENYSVKFYDAVKLHKWGDQLRVKNSLQGLLPEGTDIVMKRAFDCFGSDCFASHIVMTKDSFRKFVSAVKESMPVEEGEMQPVRKGGQTPEPGASNICSL